jgi:hypothetical protein
MHFQITREISLTIPSSFHALLTYLKLIEEEAIASCQPSDERMLVFNATFINISVIPSDDNYSNHNISLVSFLGQFALPNNIGNISKYAFSNNKGNFPKNCVNYLFFL